MRKLAFALAFGGILVGPIPIIKAAPYDPQVGERHPDFTLPRIGDRAPVSLSDFRGQKVLLIHFASW